ncbi:hypothetical protein TSTA_000470 [Talaromyces stipitatus ATCC 10500]|uniref:Uncharacterized protein n=1 Tax=Talaromyces stipitatus (strain ATCC 10500 / CBS 375.48 / QM 6759 / NRRL 1006) TaxID=441959 RepID=B8MSB7_TALSN|nr:uncharacterized protein TSTA_000470 [Talaromyces stipitatus ATCC 10500]EED11970.1 hypothetical protein TSTA_000470 [Talaromyces stipitatus ATCC 10500]
MVLYTTASGAPKTAPGHPFLCRRPPPADSGNETTRPGLAAPARASLERFHLVLSFLSPFFFSISLSVTPAAERHSVAWTSRQPRQRFSAPPESLPPSLASAVDWTPVGSYLASLDFEAVIDRHIPAPGGARTRAMWSLLYLNNAAA